MSVAILLQTAKPAQNQKLSLVQHAVLDAFYQMVSASFVHKIVWLVLQLIYAHLVFKTILYFLIMNAVILLQSVLPAHNQQHSLV